MIRIQPVFFVVLLLLLVNSCIPGNRPLNKVWFYTYKDDLSAADSRSGEGESNRHLIKLNLSPAHFLNLQAYGKYSMDFGEFEYGTWVVNKNVLTLTSHEGKSTTIAFRLQKSELLIQVPVKNGVTAMWHFDGWPLVKGENPFSLENNLWRVNATHKETEAEIVKRLHNHFRYWEKYLNWGLTLKRNSLDVRSLPGPLKMYGNGFQLLPYNEWPEEWRSNFYDNEDCSIAYDKLRYFFDHDNISWGNTDNRFKMFIGAFQQLQQKVH